MSGHLTLPSLKESSFTIALVRGQALWTKDCQHSFYRGHSLWRKPVHWATLLCQGSQKFPSDIVKRTQVENQVRESLVTCKSDRVWRPHSLDKEAEPLPSHSDPQQLESLPKKSNLNLMHQVFVYHWRQLLTGNGAPR